jgi:hypothetical protein
MGVVRDGGTGIGVNPNGHYFPFVKEITGAKRLFADMYLGHRVESAVLPLRLSYIQGFTQPDSYSPSNRADLIVVDADDNVIFNSNNAADYRYNEWSDRFTIHEWISAAAVCRIVQHTGQNDLEDVLNYPFEQYLTDAVLDERVSELWPKGVTKVIANGTDITGDLEILQGYNFQTTLDSVVRTGGRSRVNSVSVSAEAGVGEGLAPGCEEAIPLLRRINQVGPTEKGAFVLSASACLSVIRPATFVSNYVGSKAVLDIERDGKSGVLLKNNCLPCCSCDDFVNTYKGIRQLYDRYAVLGDRANVVRDRHAENVNRWLAQKECREALPIKTGLMPYKVGTASGVKAVVGVCNASGVCKGEVETTITFEVPVERYDSPREQLFAVVHPDSIFSYVDNGLKPQRYTLSGDWPEYKVKWDVLESQALARVKFDMILSRGGIIEYNSTFDVLNRRDGDKLFDGRINIYLKNRKDIPESLKSYYPKTYSVSTREFWFPGLLVYDVEFKITCPDPETGEEVVLQDFSTTIGQNKGITVPAVRGPKDFKFKTPGGYIESISNKFIVPGLTNARGDEDNIGCNIELVKDRSDVVTNYNDYPYSLDRIGTAPFCAWIDPTPNSITNLPCSLRITSKPSQVARNSRGDSQDYRESDGTIFAKLYKHKRTKLGFVYASDPEPFYAGRLFVDAVIPPFVQTKILADDYLTMNVSARVLDDPTGKVYTASETAGLKDIP